MKRVGGNVRSGKSPDAGQLLATITSSPRPGLRVYGNLNAATAPQLKALLCHVAEQSAAPAEVRLRVRSCNLMGISSVITARRHARARGSDLRLVETSAAAQAVLQRPGFTALFDRG